MRRYSFLALTLGCFVSLGAAVALSPLRTAQDGPKPSPEIEHFKKMAGVWDAEIDMGGQKQKGIMTYTMGPGGLWLISDIKFDFFSGHGVDGYDVNKKKHFSIWVDSSNTAMMTMESTYDKNAKTITSMADGTGMDGKPTKSKLITTLTDDDHMTFKMWKIVDGKETDEFVINYSRKK